MSETPKFLTSPCGWAFNLLWASPGRKLVSLGFVTVLIIVAGFAGVHAWLKETPLSGQVFIVTQGADNVKLGAVEIILIEKGQVIDHLHERQVAIDDQIRTKKMAFNDALDAIATAKSNIETATDNLQAAVVRSESSAEYLRIQAQKDALSRTNAALSDQEGLLEAQLKACGISDPSDFFGALPSYGVLVRQQTQQSLRDQGVDVRRVIPLLSQYKKISEALQAGESDAFEKQQQLEKILAHAGDEERPKLGAAQNAYNIADSKAASLREGLNQMPTIDDYLLGFQPVVIRKTLTDADGRFSIGCPRRKAFMLYAKAQRTTLQGTEYYYWLVDAPANSDAAQVILSNGNLWHPPALQAQP
jgi:hypothetical protein